MQNRVPWVAWHPGGGGGGDSGYGVGKKDFYANEQVWLATIRCQAQCAASVALCRVCVLFFSELWL